MQCSAIFALLVQLLLFNLDNLLLKSCLWSSLILRVGLNWGGEGEGGYFAANV